MEHDHPVATGDLADQVFPHMRQSPPSTPIWRRGRPRALMHKFSGEHRPELQDSPPRDLARDIHRFREQGFDVAIAERGSIEPDDVSNRFRRNRCRKRDCHGHLTKTARRLWCKRGKRILLARGSVESEQFLERRTQDPILRLVTEVRLELPCDLALQQYDQILADFSSRIAPEIG
jgi:hypothetical protein